MSLARGVGRRSMEEMKRFAQLVLSREGIRGPQGPYPLIDFTDSKTVGGCKAMSDGDLGAFSTASLQHIPKTASEPAHARFSGSISTELPPNDPEVIRTGFAGWRNKDRPRSIFGKSLWDLDPYVQLALRVKSDGRKYFVNLQTESIEPTDLHQHRLHTRTPGEWETVFIDLHAFVRTNHGQVVEPQNEMLRQKVRSIGMSLTDRVLGPYDLAISKVWASAGVKDEKMLEDDKRTP